MIETLTSSIPNPKTVRTLLKAEKKMGLHFIESAVMEIAQAEGLWKTEEYPNNPENAKQIEQLKKEAHDLEIEAHTYYPQYEGQFATDAEYETDSNQHYAEINRRLEECWTRLEELGYHKSNGAANAPARVSLVLNSEVDAHFKTLQQAGIIFLFTEWDGRGRESGYHFGLDVDWSMLPKRDRDDPWGGIYNKGRAAYNCCHLGERLIGAQPYKPRRVVRNGKKVWTIEPPRGQKAPTDVEDVCLRLVIPLEIQGIVMEHIWKALA